MTQLINMRHQPITKTAEKYFKLCQDIDIYFMTNQANDSILSGTAVFAINCMMTSDSRDTLNEFTTSQIKELMAVFYIDTCFYPPSKDIYSDLQRLSEAEVRQAVDEFNSIADKTLIITKAQPTPPKTIDTEHISTEHIMNHLDYTEENGYTKKTLNTIKQRINYIRSRVAIHELAKTQEQAQEQA